MTGRTPLMNPTKLELAAIRACVAEACLPGVSPDLDGLRVAERNYTGYGFFAAIDPDSSPMIFPEQLKDANLSPLVATAFHPEMPGTISFMVWLKNCRIELLEGASSVAWPADETLIEFGPRGPKSRS